MDVENFSLWKERIQNCLDSNLPVKIWCKQNNISPPTFYYWRKRLEQEKDSIQESTPVFAKVTSVASSNATVQQTALQISWNQMHFNISTKEEAELAAYFIHQLQSIC